MDPNSARARARTIVHHASDPHGADPDRAADYVELASLARRDVVPLAIRLAPRRQ